MDQAVVWVAVAERVESFGRNIKGDNRRIIDVPAGIDDLNERRIILVADRARLKLLGREENRRISRDNAASWREVNGADVKDQLKIAVKCGFADGAADVRIRQFRRVLRPS